MLPLIFACVAAASAATGTYVFMEAKYEAILAEREATHAIELAAATANALAETIRLQKEKDEALKQAQIRLTAIRRDAAASQSALAGLSEAADTALRSASHSHSTCLADANALTVVLGKCSAELHDMAADADGWHNEALTLREAWPQKE